MPLDLTEVERLKLENLNLKRFALETQLQQVLVERGKLIEQIEEKHPGWHWKDAAGFVPDEEYGTITTKVVS